MGLFEGISKEREKAPEEFEDKYGSNYSEAKTTKTKLQKKTERYEYRTVQFYSDLGGIQENRPYIASVGRAKQVRIMQIQDDCGIDITPSLTEFLEKGSRKQPKRETAEGTGYEAEWFGLVASKVLNAEEMLDYKRKH